MLHWVQYFYVSQNIRPSLIFKKKFIQQLDTTILMVETRKKLIDQLHKKAKKVPLCQCESEKKWESKFINDLSTQIGVTVSYVVQENKPDAK